MTTLHDTEVDGVRCFWVETGRPTLAARLAFRHGMADEAITESGWQHLIEHVALAGFDDGGPVDVNGQVSLHETTFDFHGDPEGVVAHLARLSEWVQEPAFDRLDHEIGVLRAEADVRGSSPLGRALSWRYGARGPGLAAFTEPGLGRATADALTERVRAVFTTGNGVLVLDGPPPTSLKLGLHPGELLPIGEAVPVEEPPAAYEDGPGVIASGVVAREGDMFVGVDVLQRVLVERLRHNQGGAYAPWTHYERVDATSAVVTAGSDLQPELMPSIVPTMLSILEELAVRGPEPSMLEDAKSRIVRGMRDPYAAIGVAMGAGMRRLHGRTPESLEEMVARVESASVEGLAEGFGHIRDSLLLGAPTPAHERRPLRLLRFPTTAPAGTGSTFRAINWPADDSRLSITHRGLEIHSDAGVREVRFADVAGYFVYADGLRLALRFDGYALGIDPRWWRNGGQAVAELDQRIPSDLHLPHPAIPDAEPPRLISRTGRWRSAMAQRLSNPTAVYLGVFALYALFVIGTVGSMLKQGALGLVVLAAVGATWGAVGIHRALTDVD